MASLCCLSSASPQATFPIPTFMSWRSMAIWTSFPPLALLMRW
jgi:hypothetical protein